MPKILLIVSKNKTALQYYRQLIPHQYLKDVFEDFEIEQAICDTDEFSNIPDEIIKNYEVIYFLRHISNNHRTAEYINRCHKLGCKVFFDIDDYWRLPEWHPMYFLYKRLDLSKQVDEAIKLSDLVITTTYFLQRHILKLNKNCVIIPNTINHHKEQFHRRKIENNRLRFGWIGGVYHYYDIEMLRNDFKLCYNDVNFIDNSQICLGGFTPGGGEYEKIEEIMTDNYNFDIEYKKYLKSNTRVMEHITFDQPYRRLYGKDIEQYATLYNEIDVSLIPLKQSTFSQSKSQLKIIEAGIMGKAVIVSEVVPYILNATKENAVIVPNVIGGFYNAMKKMTKDKCQELSGRLTEMVIRDFDIDMVTKMRAEIYKYYV